MSDIRVGIIIPDRGDRPALTVNCLRMMKAQTKQPYITALIDATPSSVDIDLVKRYRIGYEQLTRGNGAAVENNVDVIAFIENDDYYHPTYLEKMCDMWDKLGRPDLFGINYTTCYHLGLGRYYTKLHPGYSSAYCTLIKPGLDIQWPADNARYLDHKLWHTIENAVSYHMPEITISMKHGIGKCGGAAHIRHDRYNKNDNGFLKRVVDPISYEFYQNLHNELQHLTPNTRATTEKL